MKWVAEQPEPLRYVDEIVPFTEEDFYRMLNRKHPPAVTCGVQRSGESEPITLESIERVVRKIRDAFPELPVTEITLSREQYARLKALPILIDATLPDDTIRIGDSYLTGIKVIEDER